MPILHRDFETRSEADLEEVGAYQYARHPSTAVLCCAYAVDDGEIKLWLPEMPVPEEFIEAARNSDWLVAAHNDQFETQIERCIMAPRYGWPLVPSERHRCTRAAALSLALPAKLEKAAAALALKNQKDMDGHRLMLRLCKPLKARKG
jgi:DNA polymerase bacteriophage-type